MNFLVIALDGPTGVGKSTLARLLAQKLDCLYVDTGAMFRCLAWRWEQLGLSEVESELRKMGENTNIKMEEEHIWCNRIEVTKQIRSEKVSALASKISRFPVIRDIMKQQQRSLVNGVRLSGSHAGAVLEGRDIGTVVFPSADLKFFIDADPEIRALRRANQLRDNGVSADQAEVLKSLLERDEQDRSRAVAPLCPADDAWIIDTGELDIDQVLELIQKRIRGFLNRNVDAQNPS